MPLGDSLQARLTRQIILNYSQLLLLGVPAHNPPERLASSFPGSVHACVRVSRTPR
jgi:hypothetical protein